ncbi:hypothetical protein HQ590_03265 [bacterium]|nr:hypothetical protein [bacterium]
MNTILSKRGRGATAGFNLIEVTLAVAICGIGLITVLGLVAGAVDASRGVSDETLICNLVDDMMDWARITPYGKEMWFPLGAKVDDHSTAYPAYLDANGNLPNTDYNQPNPFYSGPYFRFTFRPIDHPQFGAAGDLTRVIVTVDWPLNPSTLAPVDKARHRVFVTNVVRR